MSNLATPRPNPGKGTITKLASSKEKTTCTTKSIQKTSSAVFHVSVYSDEYLNQIDLA